MYKACQLEDRKILRATNLQPKNYNILSRMEMQESDKESDFIDPPNMSEGLVSPREFECVLLNNISSTSHRESSNINMDKEEKANIKDKSKMDDSLSFQIDCSFGKGEEKALCFTTDGSCINQRDYSSFSQRKTPEFFDLTNCKPEVTADFTNSNEVLVQLKIEEAFELKQPGTFHLDLNQTSVLTNKIITSPGHQDILSEVTLKPHIPLTTFGIESPEEILPQESNSFPFQELSNHFSIPSQVETGEAPNKRRIKSNKEVNNDTGKTSFSFLITKKSIYIYIIYITHNIFFSR